MNATATDVSLCIAAHLSDGDDTAASAVALAYLSAHGPGQCTSVRMGKLWKAGWCIRGASVVPVASLAG